MGGMTMTTDIPIISTPEPLPEPAGGYATQLTAPAADGKKPVALGGDAHAQPPEQIPWRPVAVPRPLKTKSPR